MRNPVFLWVLAFVITALLAVYQRMTGPTTPLHETVELGDRVLDVELGRAGVTSSDFAIAVHAPVEGSAGSVFWKRFGTSDTWTETALNRDGDSLRSTVPRQPAGGKLLYRLELRDGIRTSRVPDEGAVTLRFTGEVPAAVLALHILVIFTAMLFSTRAGLESLSPRPRYNLLPAATTALLLLGGLVLGPVVQKFALDAWWTGWPVGKDLTENKTAVAFLIWFAAWRYGPKSPQPWKWMAGAGAVTVLVFLLPHGLLGSEYDYSRMGLRP